PPDSESRLLVEEAEHRVGPLPLSLRTWCEVVGEVNFMGSHRKLSTYVHTPGAQELAQGFLSLFAEHRGQESTSGDSLRQAFELSQSLLKEVVQGIKTGQPRSPRVAAGVEASRQFLNQLQRPTATEEPYVESDPLVVEPYFPDLEDEENGEAESE